MNQKKKVLMAVGSSGGHIYPAVAVTEKLENIAKDGNFTDRLNVYFVHSGSPLAKKIFSSLKYPVHEISIGGLAKGQSFVKKIKTLFSIPKAFIKSLRLIKKLKVHVVLGTGGAVTGPVLLAGFLMRRKIAVWEANSSMGLANKWLSPFVSCIFTAFPKVTGVSQKKQIFCSYPLRNKVQANNNLLKESSLNKQIPEQQSEKQKDNFFHKESDDSSIFKVLILGGSQGSFFLNEIVSQAVEEGDWRKDIFIYHQTGEKFFDCINDKYKFLKGVSAFAFSLNIGEYYKKCDLIFSRAGSGAIWEIASYGKALLLVPLTYSAGSHQLKNALELSSKNCVEMIKEKDFNVKVFKDKLLHLKQDSHRRKQLAQSLKTAYKGDGAKK